MNSQFKLKFLQHLNRKNESQGFTLIELLVVMIIVGVLAAIALPNLLSQVAKGRQAEARSVLGVINRAQQAYRGEKATFTVIDNLGVDISPQYYQAPAGGDNNQTFASHAMNALANYDNDIRDYVSAVGQSTAGVYVAIVCENTSPNVAAQTVAASVTPVCPATNTQQVR